MGKFVTEQFSFYPLEGKADAILKKLFQQYQLCSSSKVLAVIANKYGALCKYKTLALLSTLHQQTGNTNLSLPSQLEKPTDHRGGVMYQVPEDLSGSGLLTQDPVCWTSLYTFLMIQSDLA